MLLIKDYISYHNRTIPTKMPGLLFSFVVSDSKIEFQVIERHPTTTVICDKQESISQTEDYILDKSYHVVLEVSLRIIDSFNCNFLTKVSIIIDILY